MKEEFRKAIYQSMREYFSVNKITKSEHFAVDDFRNRITKGLLVLDFNSPSLGQVFRPYIQTGYIYWLSPAELVSHATCYYNLNNLTYAPIGFHGNIH